MRSVKILGCSGCPFFRGGGWFRRRGFCGRSNAPIPDFDLWVPNPDGLDVYRISKSCPLPHLEGIQGYMGAEQERLDICPPAAVLPYVPEDISNKKARGGVPMEFKGVTMNFATDNLRLYRRKGVKCVSCGAEGRYFAIERNRPQDAWQLRLYAIDYDGLEVLMTKDHVHPISLGGKRTAMRNLEPMCVRCNELKGNNTGGTYGIRAGRVEDSDGQGRRRGRRG